VSSQAGVEGVDREAASPEEARLFDIYKAFVEGRLSCVPEYFHPEGCYRPSGTFPGMLDRYVGHDEIVSFWHAATEPWEWLRIEVDRVESRGEDVCAQIWLSGRGRESQIDVMGVEAGHLVRFRDLKIMQFLAYPTWELAMKDL
jgi:hypothetical protein